MDRNRPLWEYWFCEGLEGGQWGLLSKMHHSMVDGVSGTDLCQLVLDPTPVPRPPEPDSWDAARTVLHFAMEQSAESERTVEDREAELDRREAVLAERENALARRMEAAGEIVEAADRRDAVAEARDSGADMRERQIDRAEFTAKGDKYGDQYGEHLPQRRAAALDRKHAKGDRTASQDDRIALTEDTEEPEPG